MNLLAFATPYRKFLAVAALVAFASLASAGAASAGVVLSQSSIENNYVGPIDLTITGLGSVGQSVVIEEFFDANANGTIDSADLLVRKFNVTDGVVTSIAGQRNLNIPGDEDGVADQQIKTRLLYSPGEIVGRIPGQYIFRVAAASGPVFTPFTAILVVTQHNYGGSGISGQVTGGSPQLGSIVLFVTGSGGGKEIVAITGTDATGNYSLNLPPGNYQAIGVKAGFVQNLATAPVVTVASGIFSTNQTVTLTASQRTIAGTVRDAGSLPLVVGVPGLALQGSASNSGFVAITFTDANGNFLLDATAEPWKLQGAEVEIAQHGFVGFKSTEPSSGSVTGFNIDLPRVTSLIYGSVKTPASVPVPFIDISSNTNGLPNYKTAAVSDANGNYTLGVTIGAWQVQARAPGFLVQQQTVVVNNNATAVLQDLVAHPITAHLRGQIRDNLNQPVPNLPIIAVDPTLNGNNGINSFATSDASGNFDLGVYGGGGAISKTWQLQVLITNNGPQNYVGTSPTFAVVDNVDQNGITYLVYIVTAHLRGKVLDETNAPIGNIAIFAGTNNGAINTGSNVDAGGNFDIPLFAGNWQLGLSNIFGLGLIPQDYSITVVNNVDQNGLVFRALHGTATISGTVKSTTNVAIGGVNVFGSATNGGNTYSSSATTDAGGSYSLPVFSSTWTVGVDSNGLATQGYQPVASQSAFVPSGTVILNFVAAQSFSGWRSQNFTPAELADPLKSGPLADPDGDGIVNLVEFALHLNPKLPDAQNLPSAGTASGFVTLTYRRLVGASTVQYIVQESLALSGAFSPATVNSETILSDDGTVQTVRANVSMPVGPGAQKFLRLNVISSGP